ncbi:hypothetical protein HY624_00610 [Candidatus Uhrbacteria bacterium]|nr:hypothetical protein [Candidatus Uhrbacteria bacterium]
MLLAQRTVIRTLLSEHRWISPIVLFIVVATVAGFLQWSQTVPDPDAFYHARIATLMRDQALTFPTLPHASATILADQFTDQHFLYHLILIPFVTFFDPLVGIKVLAILGTALVFTFFLFTLRHLRIPRPWFFVLLALVTEPFVFRMNLGKASALVVFLLIMTIIALLERRQKLLFVTSAVWTWTHGSFLMAPLLALIIVGVDFLRRRTTNEPRVSWWMIMTPFFAALIGVILGTMLNPYFPRNIAFIVEQSLLIPLSSPALTNAGGEWFPSTVEGLLGGATLLFLAFIFALPLFFMNKNSRDHWFLFFMTLFLLALTIRTRRTVEYLVLPMLLFIGTTIGTGQDVLVRIGNRLRRWLEQEPRLNWGLLLIVGGLILAVTIRDGSTLVKEYRSGISGTTLKNAATWLRKNSAQDAIVYHTSWDEWPMLFYWNTWNRYLVGLDPRFMSRKNQNAFQMWKDANEGKTPDALAAVIRDQFKASYVLAAKKNEKFIEQIKRFPDVFKKQYEDGEVTIFSVN